MRFVVSIVDYHSGFLQVLLMADIQCKAIIRCLRLLFSRCACREETIMDNGLQFVSQDIQVFLAESGVKAPQPIHLHLQSKGEWIGGKLGPRSNV